MASRTGIIKGKRLHVLAMLAKKNGFVPVADLHKDYISQYGYVSYTSLAADLGKLHADGWAERARSGKAYLYRSNLCLKEIEEELVKQVRSIMAA